MSIIYVIRNSAFSLKMRLAIFLRSLMRTHQLHYELYHTIITIKKEHIMLMMVVAELICLGKAPFLPVEWTIVHFSKLALLIHYDSQVTPCLGGRR